MKNSKWLFLILAVVLFQANDITMRMMAVEVNFLAGSILQVFPLLVLSGLLLLHSPKSDKAPDKKSWKFFLLYGTVQVLLGNVLYFLAMRWGGISIASPTVQSQAVWAVIIGGVVIGEKVTRTSAMGIGCFAVGIAGLAFFKSQGAAIQNGWQWGVLFGLMAGLCWATASATQKLLINRGVIPFQTLFFGNLTGISFLILSGLIAGGTEFISAFSHVETYKMLIAGAFSSLAILCFSRSLKIIPLSVAVPVLSINIIFNTLSGWLFWLEPMSSGTVACLLVAFIGIVLSQSSEKRSIQGGV